MNNRIEQIINAEFALHPRASLQDFYKLFFQSYFGAEHALTDLAAARKYYEHEIATLPTESDFLLQDISVNFPIYRVNLQVIRQEITGADELFEAFLKSTQTPVATTKKDWPKIWAEIEEFLILKLESSQSEINNLREAANNGNTVHHSKIFRELYKPHYRIICGEFLLEGFKAELC